MFKGIICCGGLGTRLYPLTYVTNKHLLPVYNKPMVYYPIQTLVNAGITDIVIVVGGPYAGHFLKVLGDGSKFGIKHLYYSYQDGDGGIAEAIGCAERYCEGQDVCVVLGDNCTDADISKDVKNFKYGAHVFLKKVPDPHRFGVPVFDKNKNIVRIEEKPKNPKNNYAVSGLYIYDNSVFSRVKTLKPSKRGELEVTDLNNSYIKEGTLQWSELKGYWRDSGTFDTLLESSNYWKKKK